MKEEEEEDRILKLELDLEHAIENYLFIRRFETRSVALLYGSLDGFVPSDRFIQAKRAVDLLTQAVGF